MGFLYRNPAKISRHMGEIDAENCIFAVMTTAKHLDIHTELHRKGHRLVRDKNSELPYGNSGGNSKGREDDMTL